VCASCVRRVSSGGLDSEFNQIFKRAFASRIFPESVVEQMGIHHVRGMLLYGPPGCGKTLIARQIGQVGIPCQAESSLRGCGLISLVILS